MSNSTPSLVFGFNPMVSSVMKVKIKYEGQIYQMDADTLIVSLLHFSEMLRAVVLKENPDREVQVRIDALEKGSFAILLEIAEKVRAGLRTLFGEPRTALDSASKAVSIVLGVMNLKKFLKGEKPDEVSSRPDGKVIITKNKGQIVIAENVYMVYSNNREVNQHMEEMYQKLSEDPEVEGIVIDGNEAGLFYANNQEFWGLAQDNELLEAGKEKFVVQDAQIAVLKIVFQKNRKWEFVYQGNKISAVISDENFWDQVNAGKRFAKGDVLVVDLEITKVLEPELGCFVNKEFRVIKVKSHIPGPHQQSIF